MSVDSPSSPLERHHSHLHNPLAAHDIPTLDELDIGPPPDGGTTAWLVVASTMLMQFVIVGFSGYWIGIC